MLPPTWVDAWMNHRRPKVRSRMSGPNPVAVIGAVWRATPRSSDAPVLKPEGAALGGPLLHDPEPSRGSALAGSQYRLAEEVLGDDLVLHGLITDPAVPRQPGRILADAAA